MNKLTVWMMVGAPGSGKTTYGKSIVDKNPSGIIRVCLDEFRAKVGAGEHDQSVSNVAFSAACNTILRSLAIGKSIVIDATNMSVHSRKYFLKILRQYKVHIIAVVFEVPRDVLIARNIERGNNGGRNVPEDIIDGMLDSYTRPTTKEVDEVILIN